MAFADGIRASNANLSTVATLLDTLNDADLSGWAAFSVTCTYASASTFTITGDYTATFTKGTKLKFTNSTLKYANVASSSYSAPNTTVTIIVNTDYVLASAAITGVYIGRGAAASFPSVFNYSSTPTGFSSVPASAVYQYSISDGRCFLTVRQPNTGTSNATTFTVPLPIAVNSLGSQTLWLFTNAVDNGSALTVPGRMIISGGDTAITINKDMAGSAWTNSGGKSASFNVSYPI